MAYKNHTNGSFFDESNLRSYYKLHDETDASGNGYNLTKASGYTISFPTGGMYGSSVFYPPTGKGLRVNSYMGLTAGGAITFSCWYRPATDPPTYVIGDAVGACLFFALSEPTNSIFYKVYYFYTGSEYRIAFDRAQTAVADNVIYAVQRLSTSRWHNIVATYDNTNMCLYLNGTLISGPTAMSGTNNKSYATHTNIGEGAGGDGYESSNGYVAEAMFFNAAWSATRVKEYYNFRGKSRKNAIALAMM